MKASLKYSRRNHWRIYTGVIIMDKKILGISFLLFLGLILSGCVQSAAPVTNQSSNNGSVVTTPSPNETLPENVIAITVSPAAPKAGDNVAFSASVMDLYALNWESQFSYELWVRQFGNWAKTSCYESPCNYVLTAASQGTIEYKIVRTSKSGVVTEEGSYYLDVASTTQTGDTLGPTVTVSHSPQNPKVGQVVTITALVNDISSLNGVELYNAGAVLKSCAQKVKIMTCLATVTPSEAGVFEYYVVAKDTYGNTTQTTPLTYSVAAN